jgi:hypothetical protein
MPGMGGDFLQRFRYGTEPQAVTDPLVLQGEWRKLLGDGKDDVTVRNRKQLLGPLGEPLLSSDGRTLTTSEDAWLSLSEDKVCIVLRLRVRTLSVAAGVVCDHATGAMIAFLNVAAQSGSAAGADVTERFPLLE